MEKGFEGEVNKHKNKAHYAAKESKELMQGVSVPGSGDSTGEEGLAQTQKKGKEVSEFNTHLRKRKEKGDPALLQKGKVKYWT